MRKIRPSTFRLCALLAVLCLVMGFQNSLYNGYVGWFESGGLTSMFGSDGGLNLGGTTLVGNGNLTASGLGTFASGVTASGGVFTGSGASLTANTIPLASLAQQSANAVLVGNGASPITAVNNPAISGANVTANTIPIASLAQQPINTVVVGSGASAVTATANPNIGGTVSANALGTFTNGVQIPLYLPIENVSFAMGGAAVANANKVYYYGFSVFWPTLITKISYNTVLSAAGHTGFSIYTAVAEDGVAAGTKIMDTGPITTTTVANNFTALLTNGTTAYTLQPGPYWFAWSEDNTSTSFPCLTTAATNAALLNINGGPSFCGTFTTASAAGQNPATTGGNTAQSTPLALPVVILQ